MCILTAERARMVGRDRHRLRPSIAISIFALGILLFSTERARSGEEANRGRGPNFVFILVDDLGWRDLGCYGSTFYETPRLDRFAAEAARFTDAYTASPVCSPTRASIVTGKYPPRVSITDWIPGQRPLDRPLLAPENTLQLALEETTLAEVLRAAGYRTFFAGKWHLGGEGFWPEDQGFEINRGGHHRGSPPGGYYVPYKNPALEDGSQGEYLPDRLTDESIRFLADHRDEPFLLFLWFYTVHTPIQASKRHIAHFEEKAAALAEAELPAYVVEGDGLTKTRQDDAAYASMVFALDENVGRLLDSLEDLGLAENTVVIFTSDNGGLSTLPPQRRSPTSNLPLRAGKGWCYEGGDPRAADRPRPRDDGSGGHLCGAGHQHRLLPHDARAGGDRHAAGGGARRREPRARTEGPRDTRPRGTLLALSPLPRQRLEARRGHAVGRLEAH